jgi:hypothetical protein
MLARKVAGWELYRQFTTVICLTNVYRQTDPVFRDILGRLRDGTFTEEDLATLNSRVVGERQPGSVDLEGLVAVLGNASKEHVTTLQQNAWFKYRGLVDRTGEPVLPIMLLGGYRRGDRPITDKNLLKKLSHCALGVFRGRPGNFLASVGMPVIFGDRITYTCGDITNKVAAANGTTGRIYGFQFPPNTRFNIVKDDQDQPQYILPDKQVKYVLVQVNNPQFPPFADLPPGVLPVKPTAQVGKEALKTTSLKQVPISPNFASTCHKLQSQTLDVLTIAEFTTKDPNMQSVMHGSHIYVLLSRVRTLDGLFLLKPITWKDVRYFYTLLPTYKAELTRLEQLAQLARASFPNPSPVAPDLTVPRDPNPTTGARSFEEAADPTDCSEPNSTTNSCAATPVRNRAPVFPGKDVARLVSRMDESVANSSATSQTSTPYVPHFARVRSPSTLLQCSLVNQAQFAAIYKYNMDTAPPTGAGVYTGPLDSTFANDTTRTSMFSWLYMPLLLNALLPSGSVYFAKFLSAMPVQYRMLICYYRRFFQQQKITWSHPAATADGPLHFSQENQELLMNLPSLTSGGSVSPRLYCETLVGLLFHVTTAGSIPRGEEVADALRELFPNTVCGFPFPSCATNDCLFCGPNGGSVNQDSASPPFLFNPVSTHPAVAVRSAMSRNDAPHRRIHAWDNNSCYVDVALQTWYHSLQIAAAHYGYVCNRDQFRDFHLIPAVLQTNFFPPELQVGLWEWLQCKFTLIAAPTAAQVYMRKIEHQRYLFNLIFRTLLLVIMLHSLGTV